MPRRSLTALCTARPCAVVKGFWCVQVHIVDLATEMIANTAILCSAVDGYIETLSAIAKSNTPPDATSSGTNSRLVYPRTFKDKMQARLLATMMHT